MASGGAVGTDAKTEVGDVPFIVMDGVGMGGTRGLEVEMKGGITGDEDVDDCEETFVDGWIAVSNGQRLHHRQLSKTEIEPNGTDFCVSLRVRKHFACTRTTSVHRVVASERMPNQSWRLHYKRNSGINHM